MVVSEGGTTCFCRVQDAQSLWRATVVQNPVGRSGVFEGKLSLPTEIPLGEVLYAAEESQNTYQILPAVFGFSCFIAPVI